QRALKSDVFYPFENCNVSHALYRKTLLMRCIRFWRIFLFNIDDFNNKCQESITIDNLLEVVEMPHW
ncbi:MAG: hypothetical protein N0E48_10525, partial [Candidatus Thiodiazotropha endolucinida]|nr:hypothetical protein [Candidatus Thiodiazotropha taylori]MCW4343780.1 hypothetical protein [Candidatus Thiodiazotropha endolucinida]